MWSSTTYIRTVFRNEKKKWTKIFSNKFTMFWIAFILNILRSILWTFLGQNLCANRIQWMNFLSLSFSIYLCLCVFPLHLSIYLFHFVCQNHHDHRIPDSRLIKHICICCFVVTTALNTWIGKQRDRIWFRIEANFIDFKSQLNSSEIS